MSRLEALRDFAQTWLGRELTASDGVPVPASFEMPAALREVHETFGAVREFTKAHNELLAPEAIDSVDGYRIFYNENQLVVRWAYRDSDRLEDDPMVFQGTTQDNGYDWHPEGMTISAWVRVMSLWQLVNGGYEFGGYVSGIAGATQVLESHYPLVGAHADGSIRFHGVPGRLICLAGPAEIPSVWAAGKTPEDMAALSSTLGFSWDYCSNAD